MPRAPLQNRRRSITQASLARLANVLNRPVQVYIRTEELGAVVLLLAAAAAMVWANSTWADSYFRLWDAEIGVDLGFFDLRLDLHHWINDGLMAIFFFVLGLEIKREIVRGELSDFRHSVLPIAMTAGGLIVPPLVYLTFNTGGPDVRGWGIPMGTDTAFVLGILALLGKRVPSQLRVLLLTATVIDDIGAISVLAIFYTDSIQLGQLLMAVLFVIVFALGIRLRITSLAFYLLAGVLVWVAVLNSGVHAILAGVVLGLLVPARANITQTSFSQAGERIIGDYQKAATNGDSARARLLLSELRVVVRETEVPIERVQRIVHPWVSFLILPLFALANAGVVFSTEVFNETYRSSVAIGVFLGLLAGKTIGIWGAARVLVWLRLANLPANVTWRHILGISVLSGVGFTFAIFIAELAFENPDHAKIAVLAASVAAGISGYLILRFFTRPRSTDGAGPATSAH